MSGTVMDANSHSNPAVRLEKDGKEKARPTSSIRSSVGVDDSREHDTTLTRKTLAVSFSQQKQINGSYHSNSGVRRRRGQPHQLPSMSSGSASLRSVTSVASLGSPGPCTCTTWPRQRLKVALLGCTSSFCVFGIRLYLDIARSTKWSSTYLIHSIIILIDMILIHLFTYSSWLSAGGEIVTIGCFLSYHFTHETVFELMETTVIAALCSIHMIISRHKHWDHEEELVEFLREAHLMHSHYLASLRDVSSNASTIGSVDKTQTSEALPIASETKTAIEINSNVKVGDVESNLTQHLSSATSDNMEVKESQNDGQYPPEHVIHRYKQDEEEESLEEPGKGMTCWNHFFEHFLDGSAGVMYTSFFGLILDELISYGVNKGSGTVC